MNATDGGTNTWDFRQRDWVSLYSPCKLQREQLCSKMQRDYDSESNQQAASCVQIGEEKVIATDICI